MNKNFGRGAALEAVRAARMMKKICGVSLIDRSARAAGRQTPSSRRNTHRLLKAEEERRADGVELSILEEGGVSYAGPS